MDEVVCSPSPVKGFKSRGSLSRGRKKKLQNANSVPSFAIYDNVEVHDEPPRLRQPDELKISHFQHSPFTKDDLKKRNPLNKESINENLKNLDGNMGDIEGPRLLMELCGNDNNRDALEVMKKFQGWKVERGKTGFIVKSAKQCNLAYPFWGKTSGNTFSYTCGQVGECRPITDRMSYFELRDVINETGCSNLVRVFYQVTENNGEIMSVLIEGDVVLAEMFDMYGIGAQIHIYLDDPLWLDDSDSDNQRERGIPNISGLRTTGQGRGWGGQSTIAKGR
ncbi:hypothetical protein RHSIM_Rhsim10G0115800 [Rhododendron simsii]|uniref:Uncharacterized protein n=1 Tax=Rhododendron simsii TaxID=118357 RepID=A0A834GAK7_RHOSS|nr:hypothetical protein RHSIM_Rhsim10G0115800 [Rhododendron simsii]